MNELETLKREIEELKIWKKSLENSSSIPLSIDQALTGRGYVKTNLKLSTKGVDTEDVSVNEGGVATYAVMNDPDGFLEIYLNGTTYYIPYFT